MYYTVSTSANAHWCADLKIVFDRNVPDIFFSKIIIQQTEEEKNKIKEYSATQKRFTPVLVIVLVMANLEP
jgi:hypothetical protein